MRYFHRTNNVNSNTPSSSELGVGEICLNTTTTLGGRLYIKLNDGTIVRFPAIPLGSGLATKYGGTNNTFSSLTDTTSTNGDSLVVFKYSAGGSHSLDRVNTANLVWNNTNNYLAINKSGQTPGANLHVSGTIKFDNLAVDVTPFAVGDFIVTRISGTSEIQSVPATGFFNYFGNNVIPTALLNTTPIEKGGTNATTASTARTNLGLAIGSDVQAYHANLTAISSGTYIGNTGIYLLGNVQSGIWNATGIAVNKGGTGADLTVNSGTTSGSLVYYDYITSSGHYLNKSSLLKWDAARTGLGIGLAVGTPPSGALHVSGSFYYGGRPAAGGGTPLVVNTTGDQVREQGSSMRFKDNISPYLKSIEDISKLNPVYFSYKSDPSVITAGLLAEDVSSAGMSEFVNYDGDNLPYSLSYGNMVILLINAVKDLKKEIEEIKTRIN